MSQFFKVILTILFTTILIGIVYGAYHGLFDGNLISNAPFLSIVIVLMIAVVIYGYIKGLKGLWALSLIGLLFIAGSCQKAKSNQQVVTSSDCGMTWTKINAGEAVPHGGMNTCFMKVVMPNYPMQGDAKFVANLGEKVRVITDIDYDYEIVEALAFIKQAKYIGKANTDADDAVNTQGFETAENLVIDKRIRDVAKQLFEHEDIVDMDISDMEDKLFAECNKRLEPLGIKLNFITLTFDLDTQTRQAIDVATAMKIYKSKGLEQMGSSVITARAGATQVVVENKIEGTKPEVE